MSKDKQPTSTAQQNYDDIQAAVMETERGRWFLSEFAQRNRVADTDMLLEAIKKLEGVVAEKHPPADSMLEVDKLRLDIVDMASAIALTKQQIMEIKPANGDNSRLDTATAELDAIVIAAETATSDILTAAEHIQEVAWSMREDGATEEDFEKLDGFATDIYTACSFQDITGQRTTKVIDVLNFLESRVMAMMSIWGIEGEALDTFIEENIAKDDTHLLNGPALEGEGIDQDDIDLLLADEEELFKAVAQPIEQMQIEGAISDETDVTSTEDAVVQETTKEDETKSDQKIEDLSHTDIVALFT